MLAAVPPYFAIQACSKAALPVVLAWGNQSPVLKIPSTLAAPTLPGKVGSFGPPVKNTNFGVKWAWTMPLTSATASAPPVPDTSSSGLAATSLVTTGLRSTVSAA